MSRIRYCESWSQTLQYKCCWEGLIQYYLHFILTEPKAWPLCQLEPIFIGIIIFSAEKVFTKEMLVSEWPICKIYLTKFLCLMADVTTNTVSRSYKCMWKKGGKTHVQSLPPPLPRIFHLTNISWNLHSCYIVMADTRCIGFCWNTMYWLLNNWFKSVSSETTG